MRNSRTLNIAKVAFLSFSMISFAIAMLFVTDHTTVQVVCMGLGLFISLSLLNFIHEQEKSEIRSDAKLNNDELIRYIDIIQEDKNVLNFEIDKLKEEVKKIQEACLVIDDIERVNSLRKGDIIEITESKLVSTGIYSIVDNRMASVAMKGVRNDKDGIAIIEDEEFEFPKVFLGAKETKIIKIV